jgi:hypothetical protein
VKGLRFLSLRPINLECGLIFMFWFVTKVYQYLPNRADELVFSEPLFVEFAPSLKASNEAVALDAKQHLI